MPRVKLPSGGEVFVGCKHGTGIRQFSTGHPEPCRFTTVYVRNTTEQGDNLLAEGRAVCHPNDQFCKAMGRRLAAMKALANLSRIAAFQDKRDRKAIFATVCPEYFPKQTVMVT